MTLNVMTVAEFSLGLQGWFGISEPDPNLFQQPGYSARPTAKPYEGFFTSTWDPDRSSTPWCDFLRSKGDRSAERRRLWTLIPDPKARLNIIDTMSDYHSLVEAFPHQWNERNVRRKYVEANWHAMAHSGGVPFEGVHATRASIRAGMERQVQGHPHFGGWDVESTLWLAWSFTGWKDEGLT